MRKKGRFVWYLILAYFALTGAKSMGISQVPAYIIVSLVLVAGWGFADWIEKELR